MARVMVGTKQLALVELRRECNVIVATTVLIVAHK
jgi:hypothetical protein